ncbi:hypothetical protein TNCV_3179021 [Trichonephila clavipes]|nr:hypothetical protein TNCV_3179021 [Trichonephila clavipes]
MRLLASPPYVGEVGLYGIPRRLGLLKDISKFDNEFFGVSEKEALFFNAQGRMLLETTYEAIVDAGKLFHYSSRGVRR